MKLANQILNTAAIGVAILAGYNLCAPAACATYIVTLTQQGSNVVATGSGTLDLADLPFSFTESGASFISPNIGEVAIGPASLEPLDVHTGFTGPKSFGSGGVLTASSGSGDAVGIGGLTGELFVPHSYISGGSLSNSATWFNQTFASLGVTPGEYTWNWGTGPAADSFTLKIASAVPEPSSVLLVALPLGFLALLRTAKHKI